MMMAELVMASWETIARRTALIARWCAKGLGEALAGAGRDRPLGRARRGPPALEPFLAILGVPL
jgi:hypothetical protein